jgi:hypothetical protein
LPPAPAPVLELIAVPVLADVLPPGPLPVDVADPDGCA